MSMFTYETENTKTPLETYEWDNVWIEQTGNRDAHRVLYIGDSISCNTRRLATECANDEFLFDGFGTSKALDNAYLFDAIRLFVAQLTKVETVIFNNGLHGWHLDDTTEYAEYYEKAIKFLLSEFDGKKIFLVLTTSVEDREREERVKLRNNVVIELAKKYNLPTIDLYSTAVEYAPLRCPDGVHYNSDGYRKFAAKILEDIK